MIERIMTEEKGLQVQALNFLWLEKVGDPYENRTRVASVKGMCPNR